MNLSKIAVGLSALVMLSAGAAQARGLMDFIKFPNAQEEKSSYRSGTLSPSEALGLYTNQQKQASFDGCVDLFPAGRPISLAIVQPAMKPMALCSDNFAVVYSQVSRTPFVVV
jgi:endonuclease G